MKKVCVIVACVALGACSAETGDDSASSSQSLLVGKWWVDGDVCNLAAVFWKEGKYEVDIICDLDDGSAGIEGESGSYAASDNVLDFVPEFASCFLEDRNYDPYSMSYTVEQNLLSLVTPSGVVVMDRLTSDPDALTDGSGNGPSGGAIASFGCVEEDGFYAGEVMPVN